MDQGKRCFIVYIETVCFCNNSKTLKIKFGPPRPAIGHIRQLFAKLQWQQEIIRIEKNP